MFAPVRKHCTHPQFAHPTACGNFTLAISTSSALADAFASLQEHEGALARGAKLEHSKVQESKGKQSGALQQEEHRRMSSCKTEHSPRVALCKATWWCCLHPHELEAVDC